MGLQKIIIIIVSYVAEYLGITIVSTFLNEPNVLFGLIGEKTTLYRHLLIFFFLGAFTVISKLTST